MRSQTKVSETPEEQAAREATEAAEAAKKAAEEEAARKATEDDPVNWDKERAARTIAAQRESETRLKAELAEARKAQDRLAEIEAEKLTAQERAEQEAEAAKAEAAEARELVKRAHLLAALARPEHQIVDAETAATLIKGIEYDDQGHPTNLTERVEALLTDKTFLKAEGQAPPPPPNINPGGGTKDQPPPTLTVEEARAAQDAGMDPAYYAALKAIDDAPNQLEAFERLRAAQRAATKT